MSAPLQAGSGIPEILMHADASGSGPLTDRHRVPGLSRRVVGA